MSKIFVDQIEEKTSGNKITLNSTLKVDTIEPKTSGGVINLNYTKPAFSVRGYGSIQNAATVNGVSIGTGTDIIYNYTTIDINRNDAFNNSTGIYTVPTAGLYQVHAGYGYKTSTNYLGIGLWLTSSDHATNGHIFTWGNNGYNHTGRQLSTIVEATVGQEFALGMSDSYSTPSSGGNYYLWFSGYLIG